MGRRERDPSRMPPEHSTHRKPLEGRHHIFKNAAPASAPDVPRVGTGLPDGKLFFLKAARGVEIPKHRAAAVGDPVPHGFYTASLHNL